MSDCTDIYKLAKSSPHLHIFSDCLTLFLMLMATDWSPFQFYHTQNPKTFTSISMLLVYYRTNEKEKMMQALLMTSDALSPKQRSSATKNIPSKILLMPVNAPHQLPQLTDLQPNVEMVYVPPNHIHPTSYG